MSYPMADYLQKQRALSEQSPPRGDPIPGSRYVSPAFMALEWQHMWPRTWHIGCCEYDIAGPGDFVTVELGRESILIARQKDGGVRGFYNVCPHRGNRLVQDSAGRRALFTCNYHSWSFAADGRVVAAPDPEDFPQGNPCGRVGLAEIKVEVLGGFVWFNMCEAAPDLQSYLGAIICKALAAYRPGEMLRVQDQQIELQCNWKVIKDNFNESYHVKILHPALADTTKDHYKDTEFYEYTDTGHSLMVMKSAMPLGQGESIEHLRRIFESWGLDLSSYQHDPQQARLALQRRKREVGAERGYAAFGDLADDQLTDYYHFNIFPAASITMHAERGLLLRPRPHPTDPERCVLDFWDLVTVPHGAETTSTVSGRTAPAGLAPVERFRFGDRPTDVDEDLAIVVGQQQGLASRSFQDAYLSGQGSRVRRHHEVLNDYMEGRR